MVLSGIVPLPGGGCCGVIGFPEQVACCGASENSWVDAVVPFTGGSVRGRTVWGVEPHLVHAEMGDRVPQHEEELYRATSGFIPYTTPLICFCSFPHPQELEQKRPKQSSDFWRAGRPDLIFS